MWCVFCARPEDECPGGIWRGGRKGREGLCVYCARRAVRELDPIFAAIPEVVPIGSAPAGGGDKR
jgi:hypothetical protein